MPDEAVWEAFFQPETILDRLGFGTINGDIVEFGSGYGTFTIPAAKRTKGIVYAIDIEPDLTELVAAKSAQAHTQNVQTICRDFISHGTGLHDGIAGFVMMFNILHAERPDILLKEAWRVLRPGGLLGIIHWNLDPTTPRGPSIAIRPRPEQCQQWAQSVGFSLFRETLALPPYHYGIVMQRPIDAV